MRRCLLCVPGKMSLKDGGRSGRLWSSACSRLRPSAWHSSPRITSRLDQRKPPIKVTWCGKLGVGAKRWQAKPSTPLRVLEIEYQVRVGEEPNLSIPPSLDLPLDEHSVVSASRVLRLHQWIITDDGQRTDPMSVGAAASAPVGAT